MTKLYIEEEKLLKQGVDILMEKLGPIETSRFLSFPPQKRIESEQNVEQNVGSHLKNKVLTMEDYAIKMST